MQSRIKKKKRVKQFGKVKELLRYREDYMKKKYIKNRPKYTCKKCGGIHVGNYEKFLKTYCPLEKKTTAIKVTKHSSKRGLER